MQADKINPADTEPRHCSRLYFIPQLFCPGMGTYDYNKLMDLSVECKIRQTFIAMGTGAFASPRSTHLELGL